MDCSIFTRFRGPISSVSRFPSTSASTTFKVALDAICFVCSANSSEISAGVTLYRRSLVMMYAV